MKEEIILDDKTTNIPYLFIYSIYVLVHGEDQQDTAH